MYVPYKALIIVRNDKSQNIGSHLLEYASQRDLEAALRAIGQYGGYVEIIRLYDMQTGANVG